MDNLRFLNAIYLGCLIVSMAGIVLLIELAFRLASRVRRALWKYGELLAKWNLAKESKRRPLNLERM